MANPKLIPINSHNPKIEKRPGYDWTLTYLTEDEDGGEITEVMMVYGAMTLDDALKDARSSFRYDNPYFLSVVCVR